MAALIRLRGRKNTTSPSRRLQSYASTFQYFKSARSHFTSLHFPPFFFTFQKEKTHWRTCLYFVCLTAEEAESVGTLGSNWTHFEAAAPESHLPGKSREVNGLFFPSSWSNAVTKVASHFLSFLKKTFPRFSCCWKKPSSFQITRKAAAHTSTSEDIGASVLCSVTQKKCCPLLHNPVLFFREYQLCDIKHI